MGTPRRAPEPSGPGPRAQLTAIHHQANMRCPRRWDAEVSRKSVGLRRGELCDANRPKLGGVCVTRFACTDRKVLVQQSRNLLRPRKGRADRVDQPHWAPPCAGGAN